MGDDEDRAVEAGQEVLEPRQAVGVEVVGRLVEQEDVGILEQRGGEQGPGLLAARELACSGRPVARWSMPSRRRTSSARASAAQAPVASRALERVRVGVEIAGVLEGGERLARLAQGVVQERVDRAVGRLLREVADARGRRDRPAVGALVAGEQAQQRGLAGAVGADEPGAVAGVEGERQPFEEGCAVVALGQIECSEHG